MEAGLIALIVLAVFLFVIAFTAIKIVPGIFIVYLLITRRFRAALVAGAAFAGFTLLGFAVAVILAWLIWIFVHIFFLIGFRNRVLVLLQWAWSYITYSRGARLITGETQPRAPTLPPIGIPAATP